MQSPERETTDNTYNTGRGRVNERERERESMKEWEGWMMTTSGSKDNIELFYRYCMT